CRPIRCTGPSASARREGRVRGAPPRADHMRELRIARCAARLPLVTRERGSDLVMPSERRWFSAPFLLAPWVVPWLLTLVVLAPPAYGQQRGGSKPIPQRAVNIKFREALRVRLVAGDLRTAFGQRLEIVQIVLSAYRN